MLAELLNRPSPRRATPADIGTALRRLRERRGMKPVQLARAAGMDVEQLLAIEEGDADPRLRTLLDLTDSLDASFFDLLDWSWRTLSTTTGSRRACSIGSSTCTRRR